jgi:para-nitrobenzyl esterase
MRKTIGTLILATLAFGTVPALAADAATTIPAAAPGHYSVKETPVGKMLDDPAADELLKKMIPSVYSNEMFHSMGRENTLQGIQQYEPEALKDEVLAKLQTELNKLPAKK